MGLKWNLRVLSAFLLIGTFLLFGFKTPPQKTIKDFRLRNTDGKYFSLSQYPNAKGFIVVFTCNHCPFASLYPPRLNVLNDKYKALGVPLIAISSTDTQVYEEDSYVQMVHKSEAEKYNYPYLMDAEQVVAKNFGAQRTPHAFVIWKEKGAWVIKYNGAIDDNGMSPESVKTTYVADAVDALLNNKEIENPETKSIGCQIHFRK